MKDGDIDGDQLHEMAARVADNAYARYSGFHVGAALVTEAGGLYRACNVENIAFPLGTCAERNAIAAAVAAEGPGMRVRQIAVVAKDKNGDVVPCAPCGACRQAIVELGPRALVDYLDGDGKRKRRTALQLLPVAFSADLETGTSDRDAGEVVP